MYPRNFKGNRNTSRLINTEKDVSIYLQGDFDPRGSQGEALIQDIFKQNLRKISKASLVTVAIIIGDIIGVKLTRNEKRKKDLVIKWYNDHSTLIEPLKSNIVIDFVEKEENCEKDQLFFNFDECCSDYQMDLFDFDY